MNTKTIIIAGVAAYAIMDVLDKKLDARFIKKYNISKEELKAYDAGLRSYRKQMKLAKKLVKSTKDVDLKNKYEAMYNELKEAKSALEP